MKTPSILIVEDEVLAAESLRFTLEDLGYDVVGDICLDGREAVSLAKTLMPDLILMDMSLQGDLNGLSATKEILRERAVPIIFMTGYGDSQTLDRIRSSGAWGCLPKPVEEKKLAEVIAQALAATSQANRA
ncbi:MAG: response regulator [Lentisphaerae bacterium]|nr:response regulator [Lentisphaerota bacterium]MBT4822480.1 response regulator [Lentisphaerota bacterium]MBT5611418.1 response regulator [Lentisphaerota bacterium]MBT7059646.1 response regulator [Lentisphaerota bacterium]MBT7846875.1 response regulator [Lentisphaerota bacterium]